MKVYIPRGISGAGKSTWIAKKWPSGNVKIFSADREQTVDGVYKFDPSKLAEAHNACFLKYMDWLLQAVKAGGHDLDIVVDNTNISVWEFAPYVRIAEALSVDYEIIDMHCDPVTATRRNVHGVPYKTIANMHQRFIMEQIPAHYKRSVAV